MVATGTDPVSAEDMVTANGINQSRTRIRVILDLKCLCGGLLILSPPELGRGTEFLSEDSDFRQTNSRLSCATARLVIAGACGVSWHRHTGK